MPCSAFYGLLAQGTWIGETGVWLVIARTSTLHCYLRNVWNMNIATSQSLDAAQAVGIAHVRLTIAVEGTCLAVLHLAINLV